MKFNCKKLVPFFKFTLLLLLVIRSFNSFSSVSSVNHSNEIKNLRNLIITKPDLSRIIIDQKLSQFSKNTNYWLDYQLLKVELYRFRGDFTYMKLELFNAIRVITPKTPIEQKLLVDYYRTINYAVNNDIENHLKLLKKTLLSARKNHFKYLEAICLSTYVKYYFEHKEFIKGREYINKARKLFHEINDLNSNLIVEIRDGIGYFWEGKDQLALNKFHECLSYCHKNNLKLNEYYLLVNIAETHLFAENYDSSKVYYYEFLKHKNQADLRDVYQAYLGLELFYKNQNKIDSAYHFSTLMHQVDDSIKKNLDKKLSEEIEKSFEKEQNNKALQEKDQVIKDVRKTNKLILTFLIIGSLLLLFIISMILYAYRTKTRLNNVLVEQQKSIIEKNQLIDTALKEKVILLKEIHHRVKNNLQIISSLLNLQSRNIDDPNALNVLEEGKERIQAIALIHQKLYQADSFATIDMEGYIEDLACQLHKTYISNNKNIKYSIDSKNINLNLDTAVPVGLIICELVTNSFKHAFQNKDQGNLFIRIHALELNNKFVLEVSDNGSGMDNTFKKEKKQGIGTEIVEALTEQLDGESTITTSENGTNIKIFFFQVES